MTSFRILQKTARVFHLFAVAVFLQGLNCAPSEKEGFAFFMDSFHKGYEALNIPAFDFDYRNNFQQVPSEENLGKQEAFFKLAEEKMQAFDVKTFSKEDHLHYDHISWQVGLNKERIKLEKDFLKSGRKVSDGGLSPMNKAWYPYYIKFYTSTGIGPEELFAFGKKEVARVQAEIRKIRAEMGYAHDSAGFYAHINSTALLLSEKDSVIARYEKIKATAYKNIGRLFEDTEVDELLFMEWPDAGRFTPPGYYSPAAENAFDQGVYYFNFYNKSHNTRAMDWLFMHEGVPGHHYQWVVKNRMKDPPPFIRDFYYPGNFEGWGAYVEYLGKDLGLYQTPYSYLGKWEWDLVRSVRILIDVGIHHYGWTEAQALDCWKKNVPNQDEIAEREVKRCTNWPAQALSYKVGAHRIVQMRDSLKAKTKKFSLKKFHTAFLSMGSAPMQAIEANIERFYN